MCTINLIWFSPLQTGHKEVVATVDGTVNLQEWLFF